MDARKCAMTRNTTETQIDLEVNLDGSGVYKIDTGVGFFDHMLELFAMHAQFDINLKCVGDIRVDAHHTVEDCGILLGKCIAKALGDKKGINRYATSTIPMDETLVTAALDISGRPFLVFNASLPAQQLGTFETELCEEFFRALAMHSNVTLHINLMYGTNTHHIIEAIFKAVAHAFRGASEVNMNITNVLSTKGVL